jgi:hypothetical protein
MASFTPPIRALPLPRDESVSEEVADAASLAAEIELRNELESPFLRLPGEIRNIVYEYALTDGTYDFVQTSLEDTGSARSREFKMTKHKNSGLALLQVCRDIYDDTRLLPFNSNTFRCDTLQTFDRLTTLLNIVQCDAIRSIALTADVVECQYGNGRRQLDALAVHVFLENMKWKKVPGGKAFPNLERVVINLRREGQQSSEKKAFEEKHILVPIERFFGKGEEGKTHIEFSGKWVFKT